MLPELFDRLKQAFSSEPITLGLEEKSNDIGVNWYARNGFRTIAESLGASSPTWANESVTVDSALNHSVVWSCTSRISGALGFLPLEMMQQRGDAKRSATERPLYSLLKFAPNDEMTTMEFRGSRQVHLLLQGNGYAEIIRRSGTGEAVELRALDPSNVRIDRERTGKRRLVYVVKERFSPDVAHTVQAGRGQTILHVRGMGWDGITGYSVITMGRQSLGTVIGSQRTLARFYAHGGRLPYVLKHDGKFKDKTAEQQFRYEWEEIYRDPGKAPLLPPWLTYEKIGVTARDAQTIEWLGMVPSEVCRWFDMSPHLAGDLSRATFSNIEQLKQEFVDLTLARWVVAWEQALWRCVLTPKEKASGYYFKFNVNALLRGDFAARMAGYATALQNGFKNIDEVRDLEDDNPLANDAGKAHHIQLNMATLPGTGQPMVAEQGILARMGARSSTQQQNEKSLIFRGTTNGHAALMQMPPQNSIPV